MSVAQISTYRASPGPAAQAIAMPANVELEQALLGAVLVNNDAFHAACTALAPEHFTEEVHRRIFAVATAMIRDGRPANPVTMHSSFGPEEMVPGVTVPQYLARLSAGAVTVASAPAYAQELITLAGRRQLIVIAGDAHDAAMNPPPGASVENLIDAAEEQFAALRATAPVLTVTRGLAADFAADLITEVDAIREGEHQGVSAATTGIPDLDRDTGGLEPGLLWIVSGRPGMGKTVAATNLARAAAVGGVGTLLFSLEVPRKQLIARVLSDLSFKSSEPIAFGDILRGRFDNRARERLVRAAERL